MSKETATVVEEEIKVVLGFWCKGEHGENLTIMEPVKGKPGLWRVQKTIVPGGFTKSIPSYVEMKERDLIELKIESEAKVAEKKIVTRGFAGYNITPRLSRDKRFLGTKKRVVRPQGSAKIQAIHAARLRVDAELARKRALAGVA